jgi:diguanylate cyclase (GGDEF)-like protein
MGNPAATRFDRPGMMRIARDISHVAVRFMSRVSFARIILAVVLSFTIYIVIPVYLSLTGPFPAVHLLFFYSLIAAISLFVHRAHAAGKYSMAALIENAKEDINIAAAAHEELLTIEKALRITHDRYHTLKRIIEDINESLDIDVVAETISAIAYSAVGRRNGTCLLYVYDDAAQRLRLIKAHKDERQGVIKAKEGDMFDLWVWRHMSPLYIEDARSDYRFDVDRFRNPDSRVFGSLIGCPLVSAGRLRGILRLDNCNPRAYTQDDLRYLARLSDIGAVALENSQLFAREQELAIHDELTGLFTKAYLLDRLADECSRAHATSRSFCLFMADIDHFKSYNDTYGHSMGDIVLKRVSGMMHEFFKSFNACVGRFGGEELCVILPDMTKSHAHEWAVKFCKKVEQDIFLWRRQATRITISIGLSAFPDDAADDRLLIKKADEALYRAKKKGRNRVCCL